MYPQVERDTSRENLDLLNFNDIESEAQLVKD